MADSCVGIELVCCAVTDCIDYEQKEMVCTEPGVASEEK